LNGLIKVAASAFFIVGISSIVLLMIPFRFLEAHSMFLSDN